ncbi:MAG: 3-deoxy-7-phosphoheptulonate synthase [Gammaproteobacteria bacterium]|nr:3-deoxy-7-phosphoheptulonate synthase [Gammaproteobacteria bacterium]MDE2345775.1 3-deoxy-7-phosphoheptulonate synthase [Gammaproteobacteria bacterium]
MFFVFKPEATDNQRERLLAELREQDMTALAVAGNGSRAFALVGPNSAMEKLALDRHPLIEEVVREKAPYKRASRGLHPDDTLVKLGGVAVGADRFVVIAGPCAVESAVQIDAAAAAVAAAGAHALRGGAYKPRTSPYSFQGRGPEALRLLAATSERYGLPVVTEILDAADLPGFMQCAAALQIGARNMQNYTLLRAAGKSGMPVVLKRGLSATLEELLLSAEYILNEGNNNVILCERGIRTFENATRNTLDLNAVAWLKRNTHLPVLVDPSHGTGIAELVAPLAKAAAAVGADGLLIEVHPSPAEALSDGRQSLSPEAFARLMRELRPYVEASGRHL